MYLLVDFGCRLTLSLIASGVSPSDILVYEPDAKMYNSSSRLANIYNFSITPQLPDHTMRQFSVTISNPPYSVGAHNSGKVSYEQFSRKQYELTEEGGLMVAVHPPGMRKPGSKEGWILDNNQVEKLSIHDTKEGKKVFKATTPYDWYALRKVERTGPTKVQFQGSEEWVDVNFEEFPFIPNNCIETLEKYINTDSSVPRLLWKQGRQAVRNKKKGFDPFVKKEGFFTNIYKLTSDGPEYCYGPSPEQHFKAKKVIVTEGGAHAYYDDGQYGVSDQCYYIEVDTKEEADSIIEYINSQEFADWCIACTLSGNWRVVREMLNVIPNPHYV